MTLWLLAQLLMVLSPGDIDRAIAAGTQWHSAGPFQISTPFSRVASAAGLARKQFRPFTADDVTPELVAPELHVLVEPFVEQRARELPRLVSPTHVVLLPSGRKDPDAAVQPIRIERLDRELQNAFGARWSGSAALAAFPLDAFRDGWDVVARYDNGDLKRGRLKTKGVR